MESKTIIEAIRGYFLPCELLKNGKINVDFLGDKPEYSIDPLPSDPLIKRYVDGGSVRQYQFAFTSKEYFDGDARTGMEHSGFYQNLADWIEANNKKGVIPNLKGKLTSLYIEIMTSGYLFDMDPEYGRYQIQCRLIYEQEA